MNFKKPLAMFIKLQEIQEIMKGFDDSATLSACGLNESDHNIEDMLTAMRKKASGKPATQLDMLLNILQATKIYRTYQQVLANNTSDTTENAFSAMGYPKELAQLIQQNMKGETHESQLAQ